MLSFPNLEAPLGKLLVLAFTRRQRDLDGLWLTINVVVPL